MTEALEETLTTHGVWLDRQPLAAKRVLLINSRCVDMEPYLAQRPSTSDDPLRTPFACGYAIRDDKAYLKTERLAKPTSVNLALVAIDHHCGINTWMGKVRWLTFFV